MFPVELPERSRQTTLQNIRKTRPEIRNWFVPCHKPTGKCKCCVLNFCNGDFLRLHSLPSFLNTSPYSDKALSIASFICFLLCTPTVSSNRPKRDSNVITYLRPTLMVIIFPN